MAGAEQALFWITLCGMLIVVAVMAGLFFYYMSFNVPGMVIERRGDGVNHWRKIRARKVEKDGVTKYLIFKWAALGDQLGFTHGNKVIVKPPKKSIQMHGIGNQDFLVLSKNLDGTYGHVPYNYDQNAFENIPAEVLYWSNIARKESVQLFKAGPNWAIMGAFGIVFIGLVVSLLMVLFTLDSIENMACRSGPVAANAVNSSLIRSFTGG